LPEGFEISLMDPAVEQKWVEYAILMVVFGGGCLFAIHALLPRRREIRSTE